MSLRLLEYLSRVYRKQHKSGQSRNKPLNPVVPIVIYNGERRWKEEPAFLSRFPDLPENLRPYIPDFRYFLLDEGRFDRLLLSRLKGAAAAFIKLDTIEEPEKTGETARQIISILREVWESYIEELLNYRGIANPAVTEYINKRRRPMFAQRLDRALDPKTGTLLHPAGIRRSSMLPWMLFFSPQKKESCLKSWRGNKSLNTGVSTEKSTFTQAIPGSVIRITFRQLIFEPGILIKLENSGDLRERGSDLPVRTAPASDNQDPEVQ